MNPPRHPAPPANASQTRWHPFIDQHALKNAAIETIKTCAAQSIQDRGQFHLVLAGGNTPREVYRECRLLQTDWSAWHIYFGDERCLPTNDPERNSFMAAEAWLDHVPIPTSQIHNIPAEQGPATAAAQYAQTLGRIGDFDLTLLGLGEDGHTASLFPGHEYGDKPDAPDTLVVTDAPKPPPERVSLSAHRLSRSRQVVFLVSGMGKLAAVSAWRSGQDIPAGSISPGSGVDVFCEAALLQTVT